MTGIAGRALDLSQQAWVLILTSLFNNCMTVTLRTICDLGESQNPHLKVELVGRLNLPGLSTTYGS